MQGKQGRVSPASLLQRDYFIKVEILTQLFQGNKMEYKKTKLCKIKYLTTSIGQLKKKLVSHNSLVRQHVNMML